MKQFQSIGTLLSAITGLLVVVLVSTFALFELDAYRREAQSRSVLVAVNGVRTIMSAMLAVRNELAIANLVLEAPEPATGATLKQLDYLHRHSEAALDRMLHEVAQRPKVDTRSALAILRPADKRYRAMFARVAAAASKPRKQRDQNLLEDWKSVTTLVSRQLAVQSAFLEEQIAGSDPSIDRMMRIYNNAWRMLLDAGRDRGFMQTAVIDNRAPVEELRQSLAETKGKIDARWSDLESEARRSSTPAPITAAVANVRKVYFTDYRTVRGDILTRLGAGQKLSQSGQDFVEASNPALASLRAIPTTALNLTGDLVEQKVESAQRSFLFSIALMLLFFGLATFTTFYVMWRVIRPLKGITSTLTSITGGNLAAPIPYERRADEIGQFARALQMFRDSAVERQRLASEVLENRVAKESAEASSKIKSEFLASMSHELRTPLNAILGFSEILAAQLYGPLGHKKYLEYAEDVHKSGAHLLELINDVLDLSKIDAGKMELRETIFSVNELIDDAVLLVGGKAKDQVKLEVCVPEGVQVLADKRLTKQILINLLSNAIKFTSKGGSITVGTQKGRGQGLEIYVADTGIGMDAAQLEKAFSPYGQIDSRIAQVHQGTGLGLPIAQAMARLQGGDIIAQSTPGHGTRMTLILPENRIIEPAGLPRLVAQSA